MLIDTMGFEVVLDNEDLEKLCLPSWEYPPEAEKAVAAVKSRLEQIFCSGVAFENFDEESARCWVALNKLQEEIKTSHFPEIPVSDEIMSQQAFSNGVSRLGEALLDDIGMSYMKESIHIGCQDILDCSSEPQFGSVKIIVNPQSLECEYKTNIIFDEEAKKTLAGVAYVSLDVCRGHILETKGMEWETYINKGQEFCKNFGRTTPTPLSSPQP